MRLALALPVLAALLIGAATPSFAGPSETAFLGKLVGTWNGKGTLKGAENGPISCKVVFKAASGGKVNYNGRCSVQDVGAQSFTGNLSYNDAKKVYEGRSLGGVAVGVKRGSSVVFTTKTNSLMGRSYSTMTVSASRITIDFSIVDTKGDKTTSHVTFSR
jgi:hypothetical protein